MTMLANLCPKQIVHVGLVEFGERQDTWTWTNRQHYTTASRWPTNQVNTWQAKWGSCPTHTTSSYQVTRMSRVSMRMLRGNCSHGILALQDGH